MQRVRVAKANINLALVIAEQRPAIARKLGRTPRAIVAKVQRLRDEDGVDLPMRNPAGAVPGWIQRRNLARARA